jgi:hypothetical protein
LNSLTVIACRVAARSLYRNDAGDFVRAFGILALEFLA